MKQQRWQERFMQHRIMQDSGEDKLNSSMRSPFQDKLSNFLYHPYSELVIFLLILTSLGLLLIELSIPNQASVGWMSSLAKGGSGHQVFMKTDLTLTMLFILEYGLKFIATNKKWNFVKSTWIDLLAILPIFRMFRLIRSLRVFKMVRLIRAMRMERILDNPSSIKTETTVVMTYLVLSVIFGTVGILVFERGADSGFNGLGDGLWWCLVTITTVGYGDISPVTFGGKVVAVAIMFIGLSFYALLTGTISTILIERAQRFGEQTMEINMLEGHIIICGWSEEAGNLIESLLATTQRHLVVLDNEKPDIPRHSRVYYLKGDPSNREALNNAKIDKAFSAIILGRTHHGRNAQDIDARSILVALAVEICNSSVHTVLELHNPNNIHHAKNAGVDEVIISSDYQGSLLAQAAASPGISMVFSKIFGPSATSITKEPLAEQLCGRSYGELVQLYTDEHLGAVLGIIRNDEAILAPKADLLIESGDQVALLNSNNS